MKITLYTNGCPCCAHLKSTLDEQCLTYETITDTDRMLSLGINHVPVLDVDGAEMNYFEALAWLRERKMRLES